MNLPKPYPGLVIKYAYLWHDQYMQGHEDGYKHRPAVIITVVADNLVRVVPITHTQPTDKSAAVELPPNTRKRLGLDDETCWAVCSEVNEFIWTGPDLGLIEKSKSIAYGTLSPRLYKQIITKIAFFARGRKLKSVLRTF